MSSQVAMELPVPLDQLVKSTSVSVVQSLDVEALTATLEWIISKLPAPSHEDAVPVPVRLQELQDSNKALLDQIKALQDKQAELEARAANSELPSSQQEPVNAQDLQALQARIEALEAAKGNAGTSAEPAPAQASPEEGQAELTEAVRQPLQDVQPGGDVPDQIAQLQARVAELEARTAAQSAQPGLTTDAPVAAVDNASIQELQQQLAGVAGLGDRLSQLEGQLADLMSRVEAAELRHDMAAGVAAQPTQDAQSDSASHAAIDNASSVEDTLPLIKKLYDQMAGKTDRQELDPVIRRLAELGTSLSDLAARCASLEGRSPAAAAVLLAGPGSGKRASLPSGIEDAASSKQLDGVLGRVFDAETSLGELGGLVRQLQDALANQQTGLQDVGQRVDELAHALAGKADQAAVDSLAVSAALNQTGALPAADGGAHEGAAPGGAALEALLRNLLADKATKAELDVLRSQLSSKPSRDELAQAQAAAQQALAQSQAALDRASEGAGQADAGEHTGDTRADVPALTQQLGDMMAELAHLRAQLAGVQADAARAAAIQSVVPVAVPAAASEAPPASPKSDWSADAVAKEVAGLKEQLDWVAHAVSILAIGLEPARPGQAVRPDGSTVGNDVSVSSTGREPRTSRGALDRLIRLLGRQGVNHKMDWFDPHALNQMATKIAQMDAVMGQAGGAAAQARAVPDSGLHDLEAQLRRLSKEVRGLKERLGSTAAQGGRTPDSDHAMLSGKPLMGYRCMACDRPLDKLQERPGPFIPTYQMPVRLPNNPEATSRAAMMRAPVVGGTISPESSANKFTKKGFEQGQRGPQNWYEDSKGLPAEALPSADVGPKLPPGGWRGSTAGASNAKPGGLLPEIGNRSSPNTPPTTKAGPLAEVQDHVLLQTEMLPTHF